jgi:hypothetical protein
MSNLILSMEVPFSIAPFAQHNMLKQTLLEQIASQKTANVIIDKLDNTNITRCDWQGYSKDKNREWVKTLLPYLTSHLMSWITSIGFKSFIISELWFQQYALGSEHDWHIHGCNWTGVYFLDLPNVDLRTQFKDPMNINSINKFNVKEGDILIFPSFVIHKAPRNDDLNLKTIISWNMNTEIRDTL